MLLIVLQGPSGRVKLAPKAKPAASEAAKEVTGFVYMSIVRRTYIVLEQTRQQG